MSDRGYVRRRCRSCGVALGSGDTVCKKGHKVGRAGGWSYVLDVTPPGGKRKRISKGGFRTKSDAERALSVLEQEHREGSYVEPDRVLTGDYLRQWVDGVSVRASTRATYESHIRIHLIPALGDVPLQALDRPTIKRAYAGMKKVKSDEPLAEMTVHHVHVTLHKALEDAVDDRVISRNPADRAHKAPKQADRPGARVWTDSDVRAFLRSVEKERLFALWRLALMSGARRGELLGLRWSDIDLAAGTVTFQRQRSKQGSGVVEGPIKTDRARRTIDIDRATVDALIVWRATQALERQELEDYGVPYEDDGLVFTREKNDLGLDPDGASSRWNRLVKASGLPRIRFHDVRHTHATLLLKAGVPTHVVSKRLGHASEGFTLQQYAHVIPGQQQDAAARLAAMVDGSGPATEARDGVSTASGSHSQANDL